MKELDKTDRKVLYLLDRDARMPQNALAKKAGLSKESLHYRIRRLRERGYITKFYTIINTAKLGYYLFKMYIQLQNTTEETEKRMIEYLYSHPRYAWSCFSSGRWDMLVAVWSKDPIDFDDAFLMDFMGRFSDHILAKEVSMTKHNINQNRRWLYPNDEEPVSSDVGGKAEDIGLDETDREILRIIANNARMPTTKIAERAETTPAVARNRIRLMEKGGVILAYKISFGLGTYGYEFCKSFIYLRKVNKKRFAELLEYCRMETNILNIVTTFGSWDLELEFEVPNFGYFHKAMKEMRDAFSDIIKSYDSISIYREYKVDYMPGCYPPIEDGAGTGKRV
ncbi:MAG: winged helix-turn-helix transcriptional regulator [Candidatus Micrarchaeota archaeon]